MNVEGKTKIVTLEFRDKLSVISNIDTSSNFYYDWSRNEKSSHRLRGRIYDVTYKDNLLYIIYGQDWLPLNYPSETDNPERKTFEYHLMVSVYDNSGKVRYLGQVDTDVNDDYITGLSRYEELVREYGYGIGRRYYDAKLK